MYDLSDRDAESRKSFSSERAVTSYAAAPIRVFMAEAVHVCVCVCVCVCMYAFLCVTAPIRVCMAEAVHVCMYVCM